MTRQLAMVKTLLKKKANAAYGGLTGETALMVASEQAGSRENCSFVAVQCMQCERQY